MANASAFAAPSPGLSKMLLGRMLRPHWKALVIALVAVVGETLADVLETIRRADVIFVVKDAAIVDHGTHDGLLACGGVYRDLFELQKNPRAPINVEAVGT